jgi:ribonucleoside-triphosphate reductase
MSMTMTITERERFHLSDDFVESYAERQPPFGFPIGGGNTMGEITWYTKYARVKDDGTKERWYEGCRRVVEGVYSILKKHCYEHRTPWNHSQAQAAAREMYDLLWSMKWTPPGRGLWMMGTEFVYETGSAALQNCLSGDTKFLTPEGVQTLAEMVDQEVEVYVGAREGGWVPAVVREFGQQPLQRITFKPKGMRSNHRVVEKATPDHRWYLQDGSVTTDLAVGDVVPAMSVGPVQHMDDDEYDAGFKHGLAFADGTIHYRYVNGDYGMMMRLCGDKADEVKRFDRHHFQPNCAPDPVAYDRFTFNFKEVPTSDRSISYQRGFLDGWMEFDGPDAPSGGVKLASQDAGAIEWLLERGAYVDVIVIGHTIDTRATNYGERSAPLHLVTLKGKDHIAWKVVSIEPLDQPETVYCATVPGYEKFTLASGMITGNCAFLSTEKLGIRNATLPFVRLMEMSMLGVGVGFDTKGAGALDIHEPQGDPRTFIIPDSREGWCDSVEQLLTSYLTPNKVPVEFDYSQIRAAGEPIKRFGGTAAGPASLRRLHENLCTLLDKRYGRSITSSDIVDIMNLIGKCVVAGNVRRSAEIALGEADDKAFLQLKDWNVNPERMGENGWGHLSNNSVFATVGQDLDHIVEGVVTNGEPGILYLDLARSYGRLNDPRNDKDHRAAGCNPCAEQTLEDGECCTLVETFPTNCDDFEDFKRALKAAYLYAKTVTLMTTHWPETNEIMQRNRRIGCSVTGQAMFAERHGWTTLRQWLDDGYEEVIRRDRQYSEWLGVRESIKTTSVKPSGTVSLLAGVTPGVHWPVASERYIRTMRFSKGDPVVPVFEAAGYTVEPSYSDPEADVVVSFPTIGPAVRDQRHVTVWEKVALAATAQAHWADNMVSATFSFQPHEEEQIAAVLRAFDGQLKTMSFLPLGPEVEPQNSDEAEEPRYRQLPYQVVSEEVFDEMLARVKPLDMDALYAQARAADGERGCSNDVCELGAP